VDAALPTLGNKVAFLRTLCGPGDEVIETHFAWLVLAGDRAWKMRKPVRRETMDYRTLEARRLGSLEDVRLNRRLAPDAYLRAVPLTLDAGGRFAIDGPGEIVDWLVCMRRLDRRNQLDQVLARGALDDHAIRAIARLLAAFYREATAALSDGPSYVARLQQEVAGNHAVLLEASVPDAAGLADAQQRFVRDHRALLEQRATSGCVVEGHGDLRPEHVYLTDPPVVIDCLEFDRDLRILDRAEELCSLELECVRLGHADAGRRIRERCLLELADPAPLRLLDFYRSHRAARRAKLYIWRAGEPDGADPAKWIGEAAACAKLALDDARRAVG
jgi:aminoglycoside phosphotransferase family enzyme